MSMYLGDFAEDSTVRIIFSTHAAAGGSIAPSSAFEADDIRIYKNNSATQKATTNGITMTSPFDSVTGLHAIDIDTSNDTGDGGFWATGHDYTVVAVPDETIDSLTEIAVLAQFSIENRLARADLRKVLGSALSETSTGYLAAGFKKLLDVATPVFTLASVNQTVDIWDSITSGTATLHILGPSLLAIPNTGSRVYRLAVVCHSARGLPVAWTYSGKYVVDNSDNDLSANLSDPTAYTPGLYYVDYAVSSTHPTGTVRIMLYGVAASGFRYAMVTVHVGKYDPELALTAYGPPTNAQMEARTLAAADYATAAELDAAQVQLGDILSAVTPASIGAAVWNDADGVAVVENAAAAVDTASYVLAAVAGACADAGTAAETYAITINGSTYTIDHTGLDSTGNRGTATLSKT